MEKTLTFTVEDALLSPIGFAVLSGAGLLKGKEEDEVHVHTTSVAYSSENEIDLTDALGSNERICATAPIFAVVTEADGSLTGDVIDGLRVDASGKKLVGMIPGGKTLFIDYYIKKKASSVSELQIDAGHFGGFYYVEASTLFKRQQDGVDEPAQLTLPNVKIQSNFTFTMASTGDPSTFTFTMDAFPGYTYFNPKKKVLCAIQIIEDVNAEDEADIESVFPHKDNEVFEDLESDSVASDVSTLSASIATIPSQISERLGKSVSDMVSRDTYIAASGRVVGTLKHIADFEDFSSDEDLQEGYYFPVDLAQTGTTMTLLKNGTPTKSNVTFDPELLFRVSKNDTFAVDVDGERVLTLYFDKATFEE